MALSARPYDVKPTGQTVVCKEWSTFGGLDLLTRVGAWTTNEVEENTKKRKKKNDANTSQERTAHCLV
ncbi:hypothetical protein KSD_55660 [Ktedonobacter sp. SOSP1-85]|nr:hypothetical protein KSD_55660 [Ktedonobacter sp. SOSP1-85]